LKLALQGIHPDFEIHLIEWLPNGPVFQYLGTGVIEPRAPVAGPDEIIAATRPTPTSFIHRIKG